MTVVSVTVSTSVSMVAVVSMLWALMMSVMTVMMTLVVTSTVLLLWFLNLLILFSFINWEEVLGIFFAEFWI